jgi:FAD binding domain
VNTGEIRMYHFGDPERGRLGWANADALVRSDSSSIRRHLRTSIAERPSWRGRDRKRIALTMARQAMDEALFPASDFGLLPRAAKRSPVRGRRIDMLPPLQGASAQKVEELTSTLRRRTRAEVRFDAGSRALYASDLSIYRQVPIGVVIPKSVDDVVGAVRTCKEFGVPILGRGCGTSLAGQCCNVGVVIDFSKYINRILEINPKKKYA